MSEFRWSPTPRTIVHEGGAAARRLVQLGLDVDGVARALNLALGDRLACTAFDPPAFAGQTRSARTVRYLREEYVPLGWSANDDNNYSLLISPGDDLAVQVATGNEGTGDVHHPDPRLAHPKGEMTETSVRRNAKQLNLFMAEADAAEEDDVAEEGPTTWILLLNERLRALYAELSWPESFVDGQIAAWRERIILGSISFGDGGGSSLPQQTPEPVSPMPAISRRPSS